MTEQLRIPAWRQCDRLRRSLDEAGITVQDMAEYLEVNRNTIGNWINGHHQPAVASLKLWALRCGVPFEWLRDGAMLPRLDSNQQPFGYPHSLKVAA